MKLQLQIFEILNNSDLVIKNINYDDIDKLLEYEKYFDKQLRTSRSGFEYLIKNFSNWFLKAELDNIYVGHISANLDDSGNSAYINTLVVDKKYQNQGIGSKLLKHLINILILDKIQKITLCVNNNDNAYKLYLKHDFIDTKLKSKYGSSILILNLSENKKL